MKPVSLISANFVREQRWPLITLVLYVVVFGGATAFVPGSTHDDLLFFLRSVGVYGLAFSGLIAASAINNERRSRRILAVLAKAIDRSQYLAGLLGGVMLAMAIYCGVLGAVGTVSLLRSNAGAAPVWALVGLLMPLFLLIAAAAMFFSTFLHPLFAAALTAMSLGGLGAFGNALGGGWRNVLPSFTLVNAAVSFGSPGWSVPWMACAWAAVEAVVFWALASLVFARRDIALAVE